MAEDRARNLSPRPRDVPGFASAAAAGRIPVVPPTPPRLLPGTTADRAFNLVLVKVVVAVGLLVLTVQVVQQVDPPALVVLVVMLGLSALLVLLVVRWLAAVGARNLQELEHGYTTLVLSFGLFGLSERDWRSTSLRIPWEYGGTWVLGQDGRVVSPPDPGVEPPGWYPSPARRDQYELWTGAAWAGRYRA
jgi:hypothetical protein